MWKKGVSTWSSASFRPQNDTRQVFFFLNRIVQIGLREIVLCVWRIPIAAVKNGIWQCRRGKEAAIQFESMKRKMIVKCLHFVFFAVVFYVLAMLQVSDYLMASEKIHSHTHTLATERASEESVRHICWHFTRSTGESIVHATLSSVLPYMTTRIGFSMCHSIRWCSIENSTECDLSAFLTLLTVFGEMQKDV